jgi:polyisoprenoid-binding protein YceI
MKKNLLTLSLVLSSILTVWGQSSLIPVDAEESNIHWMAKKVTGEHEGTINLLDGSLEMEGDKIVGGSFTVDMNSIICTDLSGEYKGKLEGHLESDDFFSVANFPKASLLITESEMKMKNHYQMTGALTIKGITHPVNFEMHVEGNTAMTKLIVDRSKYDIRFRSASFFENLGDKMIYDDFELAVNLKF